MGRVAAKVENEDDQCVIEPKKRTKIPKQFQAEYASVKKNRSLNKNNMVSAANIKAIICAEERRRGMVYLVDCVGSDRPVWKDAKDVPAKCIEQFVKQQSESLFVKPESFADLPSSTSSLLGSFRTKAEQFDLDISHDIPSPYMVKFEPLSDYPYDPCDMPMSETSYDGLSSSPLAGPSTSKYESPEAPSEVFPAMPSTSSSLLPSPEVALNSELRLPSETREMTRVRGWSPTAVSICESVSSNASRSRCGKTGKLKRSKKPKKVTITVKGKKVAIDPPDLDPRKPLTIIYDNLSQYLDWTNKLKLFCAYPSLVSARRHDWNTLRESFLDEHFVIRRCKIAVHMGFPSHSYQWVHTYIEARSDIRMDRGVLRFNLANLTFKEIARSLMARVKPAKPIFATEVIVLLDNTFWSIVAALVATDHMSLVPQQKLILDIFAVRPFFVWLQSMALVYKRLLKKLDPCRFEVIVRYFCDEEPDMNRMSLRRSERHNARAYAYSFLYQSIAPIGWFVESELPEEKKRFSRLIMRRFPKESHEMAAKNMHRSFDVNRLDVDDRLSEQELRDHVITTSDEEHMSCQAEGKHPEDRPGTCPKLDRFCFRFFTDERVFYLTEDREDRFGVDRYSSSPV